jgi:hypothetical protein
MLEVVAAARLTIPATVPEALEQLGWPEAVAGPEDRQRAFVNQVQREVRVLDLNVDTRGRRFASLRISYRDTHPERVAAFPNLLRDLWMQRQEGRIRVLADLERTLVTHRLTAAERDLDNARNELRILQQRYSLDPMEGVGGRALESSRLNEQINAIELHIAELLMSEQSLAARATSYRLSLEDMPRRVPDPARANPILLQQIQRATQSMVTALNALARITAAHDNHSLRSAQFETAQARLDQLRNQQTEDSQRPRNLVENQAYLTIRASLVAADAELSGVLPQLERERIRLNGLTDRLAALPGIWAAYQDRLSRRDQALTAVNALMVEQAEQTQAYDRLAYQQSIEVLEQALVPPRPTEPNITMMALAGSALGLGAAIALILLIDFAQSTFKTIDDVERGLSVPVLGAMAHLEPEEQRLENTSRRRRAVLVAGAFLVLLVTSVTIYYVDPSRLPPFARDLFDLLLGETS